MAKEWAWSFSKLKNFEACPRRHNEIDLKKNFIEEVKPGSPLDIGNKVHTAMAAALKGEAPPADDIKKLHSWGVEWKDLQPWVDCVQQWPGELHVEQQYAITRDFRPTAWFAPNTWYRGIGDAVKIHGSLGLIVDWKTGKMPDEPVSPQLFLMAQCLFSSHCRLHPRTPSC